MLLSVFILILSLALAFALIISILIFRLSKRNLDPNQEIINTINNLLPQTQCAQCDYPGCVPYASAIVKEKAPINKCVPGGTKTIEDIARLLNQDVIPLNTENKEVFEKPMIVSIDEENCIGCTKCIDACPVAAIVGAPKKMHSILPDYCTGCMLCISPCPTDCIKIIPKPNNLKNYQLIEPKILC